MSNPDGNQPDPNELNLPGDDEQLDGLEDLELPGSEDAEPLADLGDLDLPDDGGLPTDLGADGTEPLDGESLEDASEMDDASDSLTEDSSDEDDWESLGVSDDSEEEEEEEAEPKKGIGLAGFAVFGLCALSILLLIALDVMVFLKWGFLFMLLMNVFWLIATAIPFIMWMGRKTLNFQEVMLGLSLAAIIVAVSLLLVEMVAYQGEVKPKGGTASTTQLGAERTIAVA